MPKPITRFAITGADPGWTVSVDGTIRKWNRVRNADEIINDFACVNLGVHDCHGRTSPAYSGPLLPVTVQNSSKREFVFLVDEIVCLQFHGAPPNGSYRGADVHHIDGDRTNNHAHNLEWRADGEYEAALHERSVLRLMRPDNLQIRQKRSPATQPVRGLRYVMGDSLPDWQPTSSRSIA